ncbi:MAG: outer membrane beta-barrel protein [Muribaculum sp.]|nr:outer membrane beta-barrel protein [Muribaculum sp.]
MSKLIHIIYSCLLLIVPQTTSAFTINGKVTNSEGAPVEFANITLYNITDTTFVNGSITDVNGIYSVETPNFDSCFFKCSIIGYSPFITTASTENNAIDVILTRDAYMLKEVTINAHAPISELTARGVLTNISNTQLSSIGTADDILDYIPLVVREGGSFSVFGHGKPIFFINGRRIIDKSELGRIRSQDILNIEVITNPGAKYPASTTSVIMIRTRRQAGEGLSGSFSSDYLQAHRASFIEQASLNFRKKQLDVFVQFGFNKSTSRDVNNSYLKTVTDRTWEHYASEHILNLNKRLSFTGGINYVVDNNSSVGVRYTFKTIPQAFETGNRRSESYENSEPVDVINATINIAQKRCPGHLLNAYYVGKINNADINLNVDYVNNRSGSSLNNVEQSQNDISRFVNSESDITNKLIATKLIVEFPLFEGRISGGIEYSHTDRKDKYSNRENYVSPSNLHLKNTNIAPFMEYAKRFIFGDVSIGARFEYLNFTYYENNRKIDEQSRRYSHIYPSLAWSKQFGKTQLQASYNLYTSHPSYAELSENTVYANRYQYQKGNPYLKSGINHSVSITAMWKFLILNTGYDVRRNAIVQSVEVSEQNPSVSIMSYANVPSVKTAFAYLSARPILGVYRPQFMLSFSKQWFSMKSIGERIRFDKPLFSIRLNNIFVLTHDWQINVLGTFQSKYSLYYNNERRNYVGCSASIYKWFLRRTLQVRVSGNDLFNTKRSDIDFYLNCAQGHQYSYSDSRNFVISIRYNFNYTRSKYLGKGAGQSEKDRL